MNGGVSFVMGTIVGGVFGFLIGGVMRSAKERDIALNEDERSGNETTDQNRNV